MKVLIINGSPKANGNTACALSEMVGVFDEEHRSRKAKIRSSGA